MEQIKADMVKIKAAVDTAKKADLAVIFAGIPDSFESESGDRANIEMPESYLELISHLVSEKIPVVVVLMGGSVMDLPFRKDVDALLLAGLTGQNNGTAVCDLLFGKKNPSGRLAETWPMKEKMQKLTDFGKRDVKYAESIYVGYRYYDKTGTAVAYPFGYGLSYTAFEYSNMKLSTHMLVAGEEVTVTVKVKNTGDRSGKEVVQIYVSAPETTLFKAKWELKGFTKTPELKPGESCPVEVKLQAEELQYYNVKAKKWHLESGAYRIAVCRNSRTVLCEQKLEVRGETGITVPDYRKEAPEYYSIQEGAEFSEEQFQGIYGRAFPEEFQARPFHMNSTIGDVLQLKWIAKLYRRIEPKLIDSLVSMGGMSEEEKAQMDTKAAQMLIRNVMDGLPLRNLINLSKGKIGVKGVKRLIWILNLLGGRKKETGK